MHLVPLSSATCPHGTGPVQEVLAGHPLIGGQFNLTSPVVEMSEERGGNFPCTGVGIGTNGIDTVLGEVGIETGEFVSVVLLGAATASGRHCVEYVRAVICLSGVFGGEDGGRKE